MPTAFESIWRFFNNLANCQGIAAPVLSIGIYCNYYCVWISMVGNIRKTCFQGATLTGILIVVEDFNISAALKKQIFILGPLPASTITMEKPVTQSF